MRLDLLSLRLFLVVYEETSLTRAAARLALRHASPALAAIDSVTATPA